MHIVYEVLAHLRDDMSGPAGDGSFITRFRKKADAESFAHGKTYYGKPAEVQESNVPKRVFDRWKREGAIR